MKIELREITIRELSEGYQDNAEQGVAGYGGKLDIRPPYQREFIYKDKQRNAVIDTVRKDFPLNVMYWAVRDDGGFEVIDGQQRTISICQYVNGDYSIDGMYFHSFQDDRQNQILDYKLLVYFCTGTPTEKLEWFKTINIAGEELADQEMRNAVFAGPWTADAKRYFSKTGCPAYMLAGEYLRGAAIRQDYFETAIEWHAAKEGVKTIEEYMSQHQLDPNAVALWNYFRSVIDWVKATFPKYRKEMKGLPWGPLYNRFGGTPLDPVKLEKQVAALMKDEEIERKAGIYPYVLGGDERHLNLRSFADSMKREAYERQRGICAKCGKRFEFEEMEGDHVKPWSEGGKTDAANCQMLCKDDNRRKSNK
ncbi:MAG TPA: DUF262 domain-containing protein [Longimicrobiaceae bacterium]|jgi:hypothetical protein